LKLLPVENKNKLHFMVEQKIEKFEIVNKQRIIEGELLHRILSFIHNLYNKDVEKEVELAIQKTQKLLLSQRRINWQKYKTIILNIITNSQLQHIFFVPNGEVYCEQEIITSDGDTRRIDRIIKLPDKVIVVDYKLKFVEKIKEYEKQLKEYKTLVQQVFSLPTKGYILFLDTQHLIEV